MNNQAKMYERINMCTILKKYSTKDIDKDILFYRFLDKFLV